MNLKRLGQELGEDEDELEDIRNRYKKGEYWPKILLLYISFGEPLFKTAWRIQNWIS